MTQLALLQEVLRDREEAGNPGARPKKGGVRWRGSAMRALQGESLHEAAFLALAGLFELRRAGQLIEFGLTQAGRASMRNRTLAYLLEDGARSSLRQTVTSLVDRLRTRCRPEAHGVTGALLRAELDELASRLVDTQFSIGSMMQADRRVAPLIRQTWCMCRWFLVLEIERAAGARAYYLRDDETARLGLDLALLRRILAMQTGRLTSDRGIHEMDDGGLTLGGTSIEHAVTSCKHTVLDDDACRELGDLFEGFVRDYIAAAVPADDYIVKKGFKSGGRDRGVAYDCDLILYEPKRRKLFFVQAKWKRDARTANLDDELHNWRNRNWPMTKGVRQLSALRARLSEASVMSQVRTALGDIRLSKEEIVANAHFVVVHTLPSFSAYAIDGVAVYEWNLFRNLLLRGLTQQSVANGASTVNKAVMHDTVLPLEDPERVLAFFWGLLGLEEEMYETLAKAREDARYGFDVVLDGASLWKRIAGRDRIRVLRPYV